MCINFKTKSYITIQIKTNIFIKGMLLGDQKRYLMKTKTEKQIPDEYRKKTFIELF